MVTTSILPAFHIPVLVREVVDFFSPLEGKTIVDATVGTGGHAQALLEAGAARVIGIDRDHEALEIAKHRLEKYRERITLIKGNFVDGGGLLDTSQDPRTCPSLERRRRAVMSCEAVGESRRIREVPKGLPIINGILLDLGLSSLQLDNPQRGFSFMQEGPLDMRMDQSRTLIAADLVNTLPIEELADIFYKFGEERFSRRIARRIEQARGKERIETTQALAKIVRQSVPTYPIKSFARVFQALRIAVNQELDALTQALTNAIHILAPGGRLVVIAYHSLEDRIVKHTFREMATGGAVKILTPKPMTPTPEEISQNPRARSAKLRVIERAGS